MFGIYLGAPIRDKYFPDALKSVSVKIAGKIHEFSLERKSFRNGCPELLDSDTTDTPVHAFLDSIDRLTWEKGSKPHFEMMKDEDDHFRLLWPPESTQS